MSSSSPNSTNKGAGSKIKNKPYDEVYHVAAGEGMDDSDADELEFSQFNHRNNNVNVNVNNNPSSENNYSMGHDDDDDDEYGDHDGEEDDDYEGHQSDDPFHQADNVPTMNEELMTVGSGKGWQSDFKDLLKTVSSFKPLDIELDCKLKFFLPEYVPSIGDNDAFLKIPRPDGLEDGLGLHVLDEPTTEQSDPTILMLKLRSLSKSSNMGSMKAAVKSLPFKSIHPSTIQTWIRDIENLHNDQPGSTLNYSKPMPDIEKLLQPWPEQVEIALTQIPKLEGMLAELGQSKDLLFIAQIACLLIDIPVHNSSILDPKTGSASKGIIESLHVLYTLYLKFQESQHFVMNSETTAAYYETPNNNANSVYDF